MILIGKLSCAYVRWSYWSNHPLEVVMTDEKKSIPCIQSNSTSFPISEQISEKAKRKFQSIQQPDFSSMTPGEIQIQFHELQVNQIEAEMQIDWAYDEYTKLLADE